MMASVLLAVSSSAAAEVPPISVVQVPLELDMAPLLEAAESSLPRQAGSWPAWRKWHGIDTRYRAWRGPLSLTMRGDLLHAQAHVRYQLQARRGLIGSIGLNAGCGVDEPPRQALIGVLARLDWAPDWSLHPQFHVLPTRFLDRCEVTVADIDASPLVGRVFEDRMEKSLAQAMHTLTPRLQHLRGEAARAWQGMQSPRELTPGLWLHIQPLGVALAPLRGSGSRVQTAVWLAFRTALTGDSKSASVPTPLPPLMAYSPARPGLSFALALDLDYAQVSAALGKRLAGHVFQARDHSVRLDEISLAAKGEDLILAAELIGDLAGRLTIMARPGFDAATQTLRLEDVDFVFDAADPDQGMMANLFYNRIRAGIESEANGLLAERSKGFPSALEAALATGLPPGLAPDLSELRIADLRFRVGDKGLSLSGSAEGVLTLRRSQPAGPR